MVTTVYDNLQSNLLCPHSSCQNFPSFGTPELLKAHLRRHEKLDNGYSSNSSVSSPELNNEVPTSPVFSPPSGSPSSSTYVASDDDLSDSSFTVDTHTSDSFPAPEPTDTLNLSPLGFTTFPPVTDTFFQPIIPIPGLPSSSVLPLYPNLLPTLSNLSLPVFDSIPEFTSLIPEIFPLTTTSGQKLPLALNQEPFLSVNLPIQPLPVLGPIPEFPSISSPVLDPPSTSSSSISPVPQPKRKRRRLPRLCYICGETFTRKEHVKRHVRNKHQIFDGPAPNNRCSFCNKLLGSPGALRYHVRTFHNQ